MKFLFTFLSILGFNFLLSQGSSMNNALKMRLSKRNSPPDKYTVLVKGNAASLTASQKQYNYTVNYIYGDIASITCPVYALAMLVENKIVSYAEFIEPNNRVMNDTMLLKNRIKPVKTWS